MVKNKIRPIEWSWAFLITALALLIFRVIYVDIVGNNDEGLIGTKKVKTEPQEIIIKVVIEQKEIELEQPKAEKDISKKEEVKTPEKKQVASRGGSRTFEATAYTDDIQSQGKWVGQTATGLKPQVGVVAVDPKVIPLGSKLYIEGYNNGKECIAGDTGGDIKGKRIDLFFNTRKEALAFGRKNVKVTIVK